MRRRIGLNTLFLEQFWALKHHYYLCSFSSDLCFAVLGAPDGEEEEPILRRQMTKPLARREKTPRSAGLCTGLTCLQGITGLGLWAAHTHTRHPTAATECYIVALGPTDQWPLFTASIKADFGSHQAQPDWVEHGDLPERQGVEEIRLEIHWQPILDPMESADLV